MADDNVKIQGIEFEIVGEADSAKSGIDSLTSSLEKLQAASGKNSGIQNTAKQLGNLSDAVSDVSNIGANLFKGMDTSALVTMSKVELLENKITILRDKLQEGIDAGDMGDSQIANTVTQIQRLEAELEKAKYASDGLGESSTNVFKGMDMGAILSMSKVEMLERKISVLQGKLQEGMALGTMDDSQIASTASKIQQLEQQLETAKNATDDADTSAIKYFKDMDVGAISAMSKTELLEKKIAMLQDKLSEGMKAGTLDDSQIASIASQIQSLQGQLAEGSKSGFDFSRVLSIIGSASKRAATALSGLVKAFWKGIGKVAKFGATLASIPFKKLGERIKSTLAPLAKFLSSVGRIAAYRLIRTVLKEISQALREGINNLYEYSKVMGTTFHRAMDTAATDTLWLKNSFATVAAPIIEALMPVLDELATKIANVLNLLAQLMATLSGKSTYTKAVKSAKQYSEATEEAAKETRMLLSGFDELNAFSDKGDKGDSTDYTSMFEEAPVDSKLGNLVKRLRDMFKLGEWEALGKEIGDIINGWFEKIPWNEIGRKIGRKIDGLIRTLYSALKTIDFKAIGADIAKLVNGIFEEIDWDIAGRLLTRGITSLFDFIIGFIQELDWGLIGKSVGEFIRGAFDEASEWLASYDWKEETLKLWNNLQDAIEQFDVAATAQSVLRFIREVLNTVNGMLDGLEEWGFVEKISKGVSGAINGIFSNEEFKNTVNTLGATVGRIVQGAVDTVYKTLKNTDFGNVGATLSETFNGFFEKVNGEELGRLLLRAITSAIDFVRGFLGNLKWGEIGKDIGGFLKGALNEATAWLKSKDWSKEFENMKEGLKSFFEGLHVEDLSSSLGELVTALLDVLLDLIDNADVSGVVDSLSSFLENCVGRIDLSGVWDRIRVLIVQRILEFPNELNSMFALVWDEIASIFDLLGADSVAGFFRGIADSIREVGQWVKTHVIDPLVNAFKEHLGIASPSKVFKEIGGFIVDGLFNGISELWHKITDFFSTSISSLISFIQTGLGNLSEKVSAVWEKLKTKTVEVWTNVKSKVSETFTKLKEDVHNILDSIHEKTSAVWENIKTKTSDAWETLKSNASEKFAAIKNSVITHIEEATNFLKGIDWKNIGKNLVNGLWEGVKEMWHKLTDWVKNAAKSLTNAAKSAFDEHSPSKTWAEIGSYLDAGLQQGMESGMGSLLKTVNSVANAVNDNMVMALPSPEAITADMTVNSVATPSSVTAYPVQEDGTATGEVLSILEQMFELMRNGEQGDRETKIMVDGRELFNVVINENNRAIQRTGMSPIRV